MRSNPQAPDDLNTLRGLDRASLIEKYRKLYGTAPPPKLSRNVITLAVAYRLQEQVYGGLNPALRRTLISGQVAVSSASIGTVLIREWQGQHHTVTVKSDGVEYRGERFTSLSAVARRITGQQRSGPAFFGSSHGR